MTVYIYILNTIRLCIMCFIGLHNLHMCVKYNELNHTFVHLMHSKFMLKHLYLAA